MPPSGITSSGATRNLLFASGDQGAGLGVNRDLAGSVAQQTPTQLFSRALFELLTKAQGLGTRPMQEAQIAGQEEQARRLFQTPESLIGAAPGVQAGVRQASVSAVQPTISGAQQAQQTFSEQLGGFKDAVTAARAFAQDVQNQENQRRTDAANIVNFALTSGGSAGLESLLTAQPDILKTAGFDEKTVKGLIPAIKQKEVKEKKLTSVDLGDRIVFVDEQGNEVRSLPKGLKPEDKPQEGAQVQEAADAVSLINELIPKTKEISGFFRTGRVTGSYDKLKQLTSKLALGARKLIKGTGTVSDYEARTLSDSTNALGGARLSEKFIEQELKKIRGVLKSNAGELVEIEVVDPVTGEVIDEGPLDREDIASAALQNYIIRYK